MSMQWNGICTRNCARDRCIHLDTICYYFIESSQLFGARKNKLTDVICFRRLYLLYHCMLMSTDEFLDSRLKCHFISVVPIFPL